MDKVLETVCSEPMRIGFVSFTRTARRVASSRAGYKFNVKPDDLERNGWFRTLHSTCFKLLEIGGDEVLSGKKADNEWLKGVLGDDHATLGGDSMDDDQFSLPAQANDSNRALAMWGVARNRICPLAEVWDEQSRYDDRVPDLVLCENVVTLYEAAKRQDHRTDFADMLMRYAGVQWTGQHDSPFADVEPEGDDPHLPVWFGDELQDSSALSWRVFERLTRFSQFVYHAFDDWQEIYKWAGCDARLVLGAQAAKQEILPISYRCRHNILEFADQVMLRGGHDRRPFKAKEDGGDVVRADIEAAMAGIRATDDTLVLARTNDMARHCEHLLDDLGTPCTTTKSAGARAPAKVQGIEALVTLKTGGGITGEQIHRIMELLPSKYDGVELFTHGSKTFYAENKQAHTTCPLKLGDMDLAGATDAFKQLVSSGQYVSVLEPKAAKLARQAEQHGMTAVMNPKTRVGTCHSAKGAEADNVVFVNAMPYPVQRACEDADGLDSERRLMFTTCSRARHRLTIAETAAGSGFPDL